MRITLLAMILFLAAAPAWGQKRATAQEGDAYKFAPPPPPPLDDYEEMDDECFDTDEAFRPPPPPVPPGGAPTQNSAPPPPPADLRSNESYVSAPGKFRFRVVDGEYWEKGKKRTRGRQMIGRSSQ